MTTTEVDLSTADVVSDAGSFKGKMVAYRHAKEYANWNSKIVAREVEVGEVFEIIHWNGGRNVPAWLLYEVSPTEAGFAITSYRWYTNPLEG